jgi:A/G-specific adenine glycosylase
MSTPEGPSPVADRLPARWQPGDFASAVLHWFDRHGRRDLPWQRPPTPYRVWVSEIMLQQTRVGVVIPYFERFIERFPTLRSLAAADLDDVLHLWSGLGYYARARNLHRAARIALDRYRGELPNDIGALQSLPGIGRSTAGAVLSLALGQRHPILDGNCKRVLSRCFAIAGWPGHSAVLAELWRLSDRLTPHQRVAQYNQAMMDLGATLCTRTAPDCARCPLAERCAALLQGSPTDYPSPKPKRDSPVRRTLMLVALDPAGRMLLARRPASGVWGGLWTPPELSGTDAMLRENAEDWCRERLGSGIRHLEMLPSRRHSFSHFHLDIQPIAAQLATEPSLVADSDDLVWVDPADPGTIGLPAPVVHLLSEAAALDTDDKGDPL